MLPLGWSVAGEEDRAGVARFAVLVVVVVVVTAMVVSTGRRRKE